MKIVKVSDSDYELLEWLGSDKWMTVKGEKPLSVAKVLHEIIEKEYKDANPPEYRSIEERL